jgi:hypothetical protein
LLVETVSVNGRLHRIEDMTAHSAERHPTHELTIIYADLNPEPPEENGLVFNSSVMRWPRHIFEAAAECRFLLNRELLDIAQRNLNAHFGLLRRLTGAKSFAEIVELQAAHLSNQAAALMGQSEELANLSIKAAVEFARNACFGR